VGNAFNILPGDPTQLSIDGPNILYARENAHDTLTLQLRDKYGNFTDLRSYSWHIESDRNDILAPLQYPVQKTLGTFETQITSLGLP